MSKTRSLDTAIIVRAAAIVLILMNHARLIIRPEYFGWTDTFADEMLLLFIPGGMNILLMLSGASFFRFLVTANRRTTNRNILRFMAFLFVPSLALTLFSFAVRKDFDLHELLFYSNWFTTDRISLYPVWYIQMLMQLLVALLLVLQIGPVRRLVVTRPLAASSALLAIGLLLVVLFSDASPDLKIRQPHWLLWNFALGWWIYCLIDAPGRERIDFTTRACVFAVGVGSSMMSYGGLVPDRLPQISVLLGLYIFVDAIRMPAALANLISLISKATFGIFLLQYFGFALVRGGLEAIIDPDPYLMRPLQVLMGVAVGILGWAMALAAWKVARSRWRHRDRMSRPLTAPAR